jgi:hypothetical protein
VAREIVGSCHAIDSVVAGELQALAVPSSTAALREAVARGLQPGNLTAAGATTDLLDEHTRAFVNRLAATEPVEDGPTNPMLAGLVNVSEMILEYLDHAGHAVDQPMVGEFGAALYKGWALHSGVRLASVYWRGGREALGAMRDVHEELTRGI